MKIVLFNILISALEKNGFTGYLLGTLIHKDFLNRNLQQGRQKRALLKSALFI
jgi:hypothetical protein